MMLSAHIVDTLIARILFVRPQPERLDATATTQAADRVFGVALLFSALRCTVLYVILPFVLPLMGLVARLPIGLIMGLDALALASLVASLRRFWRTRHPRRWQYLPLALVMALAIIAFLVYDIRAIVSL